MSPMRHNVLVCQTLFVRLLSSHFLIIRFMTPSKQEDCLYDFQFSTQKLHFFESIVIVENQQEHDSNMKAVVVLANPNKTKTIIVHFTA